MLRCFASGTGWFCRMEGQDHEEGRLKGRESLSWTVGGVSSLPNSLDHNLSIPLLFENLQTDRVRVALK